MGIVVIGCVFVDIKGYPKFSYIPAGRNEGRIEQVHGGVCRNVVEDIANVELRPTFISLVDHSGIGADVINKLNNHKVNTRYMRRTEDGMGTWLAVFDNHGDVVASISKRPDMSMVANILDEYGDEIFKDCDSVILEIDMDKEIVKQVRKRGPFLSMSDFINRRLEPEGGENALKGALQAAIDATDVNQEFFSEVILNQPDGGRLFKFPQADEGSMHTAAPGYLIQSDVLASLGNILTVRDDTFIVRAYGCVRTKDGAVLAQAWCEATVQREIEYVSPENAPDAAEFKPDGTRGETSLSEVNRRLGRKMRVVAFKWMDPWDI